MKSIPLMAAVLVVGLAIAVALFGWRRPAASATGPNSQAPAVTTPASAPELTFKSTAPTEPLPPTTPVESVPSAPAVTGATAPESHQLYVERRTSELQDLSANNDAASLETILSELTNRDREIRHAAIEATMQFGSRDAIPRLLETAAQTEDPAEKTELQKAADYLKLPSLTEVLAQQKNQQTPLKIPPQPPRHNVPSKKQP